MAAAATNRIKVGGTLYGLARYGGLDKCTFEIV